MTRRPARFPFKGRAGGDAGYWSAYREWGGKLCKAYVGKTASLTLERLNEAAAHLAAVAAGEESALGDPAAPAVAH